MLVGLLTAPGLDNQGNSLAGAAFVNELFNPFPAVLELGLVHEFNSSLQILARDGQPAPAGAAWDGVSILSELNPFGNVLIQEQGPTGRVFMFDPDTGFETVFRTGVTTPNGHAQPLDEASIVQFSGPDSVIFLGTGSSDTVAGYFKYQSGGVTELFDLFTLMSPAAEPLTGMGLPLANNIGQLAFTAHLPDLSPSVTEEGLFKTDASGTITEIFRITDGLAPLTEPVDDVKLEAFNDAGQTVVSVDSGENTLVLLDPTGSASVIAAEFDLTPDGDGRFESFRRIELNEKGQVAFLAEMQGFDDPEGLYFFDPDFGLVELIEHGDPLLGSTIEDISFDASTGATITERRRGLNDLSQVSLRFTLADGSSALGIFTVPEPATMSLLIVALAASAGRRRR